jgi:dihydroorotase
VEIEQKKLEFTYADFGATGLETAFSIALGAKTGKRWLEKVIMALAINPRKVFNLPVPSIDKNQPAEITIFNPKETWIAGKDRMYSKSLNSPYWGQTFKGSVIGVINRGKYQISDVKTIN